MVCAKFEYEKAGSLREASATLERLGEDAKILAGGQSLVPMMSLRLARPAFLVDINGAAPEEPKVTGTYLRIPSLCRHAAAGRSALVQEHAPLLADAIAHIGNVRIRNRGTIGGSLAQADPTAEIGCVALALGAEVVALTADSERTIPINDFLVTYLTTALEQTEVLSELRLPLIGRRGWSFLEVVRRASDFAVVGVAAVVEVDPSTGAVTDARVALAGVGDRAVLADQPAVRAMVGAPASASVLRDVGAAVAAATDPHTDVHSSGAYRRKLVDVLTRRALAEAITRGGGTVEAA
jgi:aerobic carbon-monoxide dehydrogenase medium subunit